MHSSVLKQTRLQRSITRSLDNFKKLGKANLTGPKIRARITALKDFWQQYQEGHDAMMRATTEETRSAIDYFKDASFEQTEEIYLLTHDYMAECLEDLEPVVSGNQSFLNATTRVDGSSMSLNHLPPIKLPPFDGNFGEWPQFRDNFSSLIRENKDLTNFARMHFLKSSLKGQALESIANLTVTGDNFELACNTLTTRYENPRRMLNLHMNTLFALAPITRESAGDLQSLRDKVSIAVASLRQLNRSPEELWNDMIVHVTVQKLDPSTRKAWNLKTSDSEILPSYETLSHFLTSRARALEEFNASSYVKANSRLSSTSRVHVATTSATSSLLCPLCQANHYINVCPAFLNKTPAQRRDLVKQHNRCFNCLSHKHSVQNCKSKYSCRVCRKKHHTMLHSNTESCSTRAENSGPMCPPALTDHSQVAVNSLQAQASVSSRVQVVLATARVAVRVASGRSVIVRALLDQGSEVSFISESLAQTLRATRLRMPCSISAVGGMAAGTVRYGAQVFISPRDSKVPSITTTALILKKLTAYAPQRRISFDSFDHLRNLSLSEPDPASSDPIHVIIGADVYSEIMLDGIRKGKVGQPFAQRSIFGWVISGPITSPILTQPPLHEHCNDPQLGATISVHHASNSIALEHELRRFWEIEELLTKIALTPKAKQCEDHFQKTHTRDDQGRYIVRLPFKMGPPINIGHSRFRAETLLSNLFRRLRYHPDHDLAYNKFLTEYEDLGHMRQVPPCTSSSEQIVYIPHHAVTRESNSTTPLRVVFNASSLTSNGSSLNDHLLAGPKLQTDITSVVLQWRMHKYVYTADIAKMYRQIRVNSRDLNYQRILWTPDSTKSPREYQLLTVTYGMTCAPFLALRVLHQLVHDDGNKFPLACPVLRNNIYVDDLLFGADNPTLLRQTRDNVISLLQGGGFELRKWASNSAELLADFKTDERDLSHKLLSRDEQVTILGIRWNPTLDAFDFQVKLNASAPKSKRHILSTIARLYDPFGWVTPVTITAKIFIQQLWRVKLDWDESLSETLNSQWEQIYAGLAYLNRVRIPRWTGGGRDTERVELHGFADASNVAYAAVVYLKVISTLGTVKVTLLAGKSKVAPLKPLSVPRLELSAAVLLARLVEFIRTSMNVTYQSCYCWTDSSVVLAWVTQHPSRWKTFIANRVNDIQSRVPEAEWRYVSTHSNPADCASRGVLGTELPRHALWWTGPPWLTLARDKWPTTKANISENVPMEEKIIILHGSAQTSTWDIATRYSSWPKLLRVTAYIIRFIRHCRGDFSWSKGSLPNHLSLSGLEFSQAKLWWIKAIQRELFHSDIKALSNSRSVSSKSSLSDLHPFLDHDGILRVGGRISQAPLPLLSRHPILLSSHSLVKLIVVQAHVRALHAGLQLTMNVLRRDFWILRARSVVKAVIHGCVTCARERASIPTQLMGDLPAQRVSAPKRSFLHCGLDYAGPVHVRSSAGRGIVSRKAYIALFVCLASRAIHLELVVDYTTSAFLNAYSRFCARRGLPHTIYSDNGTNFVGANKELTIAYRAAVHDPNFLNKTASDQVTWKFIPPSAPHFGGLWEAGVRSVKYHLRRVLGNQRLTFEEFYTLLCRIEACLNSRPLSALSNSPDDLEYLTPGHFLVGSAITGHPEPSLLDLAENRLSRWQLIRHTTERFWKLWQTDYVNTLQQRVKWRRAQPSVRAGQLVLLRNSALPPCKWLLGRVTRCHEGTDGHVRVVTIKTATGEYLRPINKICVLPVDIDHGQASGPVAVPEPSAV